MPSKRFLNFYRVPANFLSLSAAVILLASEVLLGALGYVLLEGYSWSNALYMTVITISTVGFTEVEPLSEAGRIFTTILIFVNIAVFAYLLAVLTYFIVEGEIFKRMHHNQISARIQKLEGHVILCGFGKYGKEKKSLATLTAIHPPERFGVLNLSGDYVTEFHEKHSGESSWINGGFFVFEPKIFDYLQDDSTVLEKTPLETLAKEQQLTSFKHNGFWYPMDTLRDKNHLEKLWASEKAPWKIW